MFPRWFICSNIELPVFKIIVLSRPMNLWWKKMNQSWLVGYPVLARHIFVCCRCQELTKSSNIKTTKLFILHYVSYLFSRKTKIQNKRRKDMWKIGDSRSGNGIFIKHFKLHLTNLTLVFQQTTLIRLLLLNRSKFLQYFLYL